MITWIKTFFNNKIDKKYNDRSYYESLSLGLHNYQLGNELILKNCFIEALPFYDIAIKNHVSEAYFQRALCLQALNYHFDALADFDIAIMISPEDCNLYFSRSWSRIEIRENTGALSDIRKAIELSKIDNERNKLYNDASIKSQNKTLTDLYESEFIGIEQLALVNEMAILLNKPLDIQRRLHK